MKKFIAFMLIFLFMFQTKSFASVTFSDVKESDWFMETVKWGITHNIISGYPDGTFRPNNHVTEAEFLALMVRVYHSDIQPSGQGHWADSYYQFARGMNYPVSDDLNKRNEPLTRVRVAELISSAEGVHYNGNDAIHYLLSFGLAEGKTGDRSIEGFKGSDRLTRAEAIQFIKNMYDYGIGGLLERPVEPNDPSELPDIH